VSLLPTGQHAHQLPVLGLQRRPVRVLGWEPAQQVEVRENVLAEPAGAGNGDLAGEKGRQHDRDYGQQQRGHQIGSSCSR
jgi:hypothetical protein